MKKRTLTLILLTYSAFIVGCGAERVTEPGFGHGPAGQQPAPEKPVLSGIRLKPAAITFFPGMTTSLTVEAVDQHGRLLSLPADAVTHSSSDSAVATVDSRGIITAISAGTAVISTTLTLNGVTATGSVVLQVVGIRRGKYELSAPVTASGWGVSGIFTAALRVSTDFYLDSNDIIGTFENLRLIGPDGSIEQSIPYGVVKIRLDGLSRLQLTLVAGNITYWEGMPSSADEDGFRGSYAIGDGFASGPFVGKRVGE